MFYFEDLHFNMVQFRLFGTACASPMSDCLGSFLQCDEPGKAQELDPNPKLLQLDTHGHGIDGETSTFHALYQSRLVQVPSPRRCLEMFVLRIVRALLQSCVYYLRDVTISAADYDRKCERFNKEKIAMEVVHKTALHDEVRAEL